MLRIPRIATSCSYRTMSTRSRPANWKSLAPPPLPGPIFAAQSVLPSLPVPPLAHTIDALKESLRPIAWDEQEYATVVRKVDQFAAGPAEELQRRLETRQKETVHWLEDWWDDGGYLTYRDSIVINVSYYYGFQEHPASLPQTPVHRAASLIRAGMEFRQHFKPGQVPPEATKEGPLCMDTWRWMFDCSRVPGPGADWSVSYAKAGDRGDSGHVVVLRRGRVWRLEPWIDGKLLSLDALQKQIQHIYDNTTKEYPGVGILTASNRDVWSKDYDELIANPNNAEILKAIHGAAFVVCLDTEPYTSFIDHSRSLWHGAVTPQADAPGGALLGLRNRWMDKPCQFVVSDDGKAGLIGEHSVMDGTPTVTLCDRVLDIIAAPSFAEKAGAGPSGAALPTPLDWTVSPATQAAIGAAAVEARKLIESQAMGVVRTPYGKAAIKAFGVSPDSWTQLIVQLAYARLLHAQGLKREGGTYEAATTRRFFKGRTEAIRVVSSESDAWVSSMDDKSTSTAEKVKLFTRAVNVHGHRARLAGKAHGVDRHLFGLKKLLKESETVPEMYSDPVYLRSSNWVLSTSAIFSKHFGPYGWGEVVPNGFGVAYMTGFDDYLQFTITSRTEMPNAEFCKEIERAANDLYQLHLSLAAEKAPEGSKAKL